MDLLVLIFAHLLGDYPLQPEFLARTKGDNYISLLSHVGIWTGTICVALWLMGFNVTIFDITWLFLVHATADLMKAKPLGVYKKMNSVGLGLMLDQSIHVLQLLALLAYK